MTGGSGSRMAPSAPHSRTPQQASRGAKGRLGPAGRVDPRRVQPGPGWTVRHTDHGKHLQGHVGAHRADLLSARTRYHQGPDRSEPVAGSRTRPEHPLGSGQRPPHLRRRLRRPVRARRLEHALLLRVEQFTLQERPRSQHPRDRTVAGRGVLGSVPRGRAAQSTGVVGGGVPVGARRLGSPRQDVRHVLLDAGHRAPRLSRHPSGERMRQDLPRLDQRRVHLPGDRHQPRGPVRRQLELRVHLSARRRGSHRPQRVRRVERDTVAAVEERR